MDLVVAVYRHSENYPKNEQFGLSSQTRRAAVSIPANIAEGQARKSAAQFRSFLNIALGSVAELETHMEIAKRLDYLEPEAAQTLLNSANEVSRMIHGLLRSLETED